MNNAQAYARKIKLKMSKQKRSSPHALESWRSCMLVQRAYPKIGTSLFQPL